VLRKYPCTASNSLLRKILQQSSGEARDAAYTRIDFGICLTRLERFEDAEEQLLRGYKKLIQDSVSTERVVARLVQLYETWGKPEKAAEYRAILTEK